MQTKKKEFYFCKNCSGRAYLNPTPGVSILPVKNGKVLLGRRKINPGKGELDTIGGFMQIKESAEETAKREFFEETGIKITNLEFLGSVWGIYGDTGEYTINLNFITQLDKEKPKAREDISSIEWIPIKKAHLIKSSFRNVGESLKALQKWYKNK